MIFKILLILGTLFTFSFANNDKKLSVISFDIETASLKSGNKSRAILINKDGKQISKCYLKIYTSFNNKIYIGMTKEDKYVYFDKNGVELFGKHFNEAYSFNNGLAIVSEDSVNYYYINENGQKNSSKTYQSSSTFQDNRAFVKINEEVYAMIDKNETILHYIPSFYMPEYSDEMVKVFLNNKFGYFNKNGKMVIPNIYEYASDFNNGKAIVKDFGGMYYYIINKKGNRISNYYTDLGSGYNKGLLEVKTLNKSTNTYAYGYMDNNEKVVIKPQYYTTSNFGNYNIALVSEIQHGNYYYIDKNGNKLFQNNFKIEKYDNYEIKKNEYFEQANLFDTNGFAWVKNNFKEQKYIDINGKELTFDSYKKLKNSTLCQ